MYFLILITYLKSYELYLDQGEGRQYLRRCAFLGFGSVRDRQNPHRKKIQKGLPPFCIFFGADFFNFFFDILNPHKKKYKKGEERHDTLLDTPLNIQYSKLIVVPCTSMQARYLQYSIQCKTNNTIYFMMVIKVNFIIKQLHCFNIINLRGSFIDILSTLQVVNFKISMLKLCI